MLAEKATFHGMNACLETCHTHFPIMHAVRKEWLVV